MKNKSFRAFTLIEMLIIISIVAILCVVFAYFLVRIFPARARNSVRFDDIGNLRRVLEYYKIDHGKYPIANEWTKLEADNESNGLLAQSIKTQTKKVPQDPLYPKTTEDKIYSYQYLSTPDGAGYKIHVDLEGEDSYETNVDGETLVYVPPSGGGSGIGSPSPTTGVTSGAIPTTPPIPGPSGTALSFNGVNSYLDIPFSPSLNITDALSIEAWVKADSFSTVRSDWSPIFAKKCNSNECYSLVVNEYQSEFIFILQQSGAGGAWDVLPNDQWIHIVGAWDKTSPNNIEIFRNGVSLGSDSFNRASLPTSNLGAKIGGNTGSGYSSAYFKGALDGVRVYAKRLSGDLVAQHYQGNFSGDSTGCNGNCDLRGAWNFDEGSGNITSDSSGNGNTATLVNGPQWISVP